MGNARSPEQPRNRGGFAGNAVRRVPVLRPGRPRPSDPRHRLTADGPPSADAVLADDSFVSVSEAADRAGPGDEGRAERSIIG
ncbi:hypothetical protein GCM10010269_58470 [Streptomyces humidus]|uniref:Uncharacterized protein n=1 Tax=Streptomyces humidus TaxID=52259 RepID=A0A918L616_9ACTN|nr:hypothetical protein GCM10010269_58470 [Streptomyces humidus]